MKYFVGSTYYMKRNFRGFGKGECVTVIERTKKGKKTIVSIKNMNGTILNSVSVKLLRRNKRF